MFSLRVENAVISLVEALLPKNSGEKCLVVQLRFSVQDTKNDGEPAYGEAQVVFQRPLNYTKVFMGIRRSPRETFDWKLTSEHDSCWRTDGFGPLSTLYFDLCKEANPNEAPKALYEHTSIDKVQVLDRLDIERGTENFGPDRWILKNFRGI